MLANWRSAGAIKNELNATTWITTNVKAPTPVTALPLDAAETNSFKSKSFPFLYNASVVSTLSGVAILAP